MWTGNRGRNLTRGGKKALSFRLWSEVEKKERIILYSHKNNLSILIYPKQKYHVHGIHLILLRF